MYELDNITNDYKQNIEWVSDDSSIMNIYLEYIPNQLGWFMDLTFGDVEIKKKRITNNYNMLRAYISYLPYGLLCSTEDGLEPMGIDDFATGYAKLCILSKKECEQVESRFYAKV